MNYVKHLNLFGVEAKQIPCITGNGAPTTATEGAVGCLYMDTQTGEMYKCTEITTESGEESEVIENISLSNAYIDRSGVYVNNAAYKSTEKVKISAIPQLSTDVIPNYIVTWLNGECHGWTMWADISSMTHTFDELAVVFKTPDLPTETSIDFIVETDEPASGYYYIWLSLVDGVEQTKEVVDSWKPLLPNLSGKTITIIGDSISTNGAEHVGGEDCNVAEITITSEDVGKTLSAYVTEYDVYRYLSAYDKELTNKIIGGHTFVDAEIGTEVTFVPTADDIGKQVGVPLTYNLNTVTVWWEHLRDELGCIMNPVCWSGSSITSHESSDNRYKTSFAWHDAQIRKCGIRVKGSMDRVSPDVILIYRGTNDMTHQPYTVLTEGYGDDLNFEYPTTDKISDGVYGYKEGLVLLISKLREAYPTAQIVLCTLTVFKRLNCTHFPTNNGINTLPQYNKAIREIADFMGCGLVEFDKCGITFENCYDEGYITDSETMPTHPSDKGHSIMGKKAILDLSNLYIAL